MRRVLETEVLTAEQGSKQWHLDRAGVFSGSNFHLCMKRLASGPNAGDWSAAAYKEARKLAFERATNSLLDDTPLRTRYTTRGNEEEINARIIHAELIDVLEIEQCGLIRTIDGRYGVSVDGLIDDDGGAEYKCFTDADKVIEIITNNRTDLVTPQVQGGMLLTNRDWWHFGLYHPSLKVLGRDLNIIEIERDETYIEELWHNMQLFNDLVEEIKDGLLNTRQTALKYPRPFIPGGAPIKTNEQPSFSF
jgi:hypothetical protein